MSLFSLFLDGLLASMTWGIFLSYFGGMRFTEVLAMGLSISLIISSGFLKTVMMRFSYLLTGTCLFFLVLSVISQIEKLL